MRKLLALLLLLLAVAGSASAAVVTINNGDGTTTLKLTYTLATSKAVDIRDDVCRGLGWTATVECGQTMVSLGQCTQGQVGTQVANPVTCLQAIDLAVIAYVRQQRKAGEDKETAATIAAALAVNNDADVQP